MPIPEPITVALEMVYFNWPAEATHPHLGVDDKAPGLTSFQGLRERESSGFPKKGMLRRTTYLHYTPPLLTPPGPAF